ncbi:putative T6SS immunity periplasmic lipoprotein [Serratia rubidaea]|uniref:putative T6SS immunity periplasmic lipoprotein n=1 Tax=Serratia rubidaea TaxID=61652 RepID=UPI00077351CE|nr:putative T6SS immunity periplasmic lipoprotein [Serratia rubidaea]MBD8453257.1 hypothetical protein [Serratia rubidaea]
MKRIFCLTPLVFLLSGCFHFGDPRPPLMRAKVLTVANKVCMMVQPKGDEQIVTVSIREVGDDRHGLEKYDLNLPASANKCVPTFDYPFKVGKAYGFSVILESPAKLKRGVQPAARIYGVSFSLWENNGQLEANVLQ